MLPAVILVLDSCPCNRSTYCIDFFWMSCFPLFLPLFLQRFVILCVSMVVPVLSQMFASVRMDSLVPSVRMVIFFFLFPPLWGDLWENSILRHKIHNQVMCLRNGAKQRLRFRFYGQFSECPRRRETQHLPCLPLNFWAVFNQFHCILCSLVIHVGIQLPTLTPFYLILSLLLMYAPIHVNMIFMRQAW